MMHALNIALLSWSILLQIGMCFQPKVEGLFSGAFSATAGNVVLSEGNHLFLGDPRWSDGQYLLGAGIGGVFGGVANGMTAYGQGKSFWSGASKSQSSYSYFGGGSGVLKPDAIGTNPGSRITPSQLDEWWDLYWRSLSGSGEYLDDAGNAIAKGSSQRIGVEIIATKTSTTAFRSFTHGNFRINLGRLTGNVPANSHAHHIFPQKYEPFFNRAGMNIHDPKFGAWWEASSHLKNAAEYNAKWADFIRLNPNASQSQILNQGRTIMQTYGIPTGF